MLTKCRAELAEAIANGATQGAKSVWPDGSVQLTTKQTAYSEHYVRKALLLEPSDLEILRSLLAYKLKSCVHRIHNNF